MRNEIRLRPENSKVRNFYRNITSAAVNRMFPGAQRNSTMRDSHAFIEDVGMSQSTLWSTSNSDLVAGVSAVGD